MAYKSPAYGIIPVPIEKIKPNTYNPNAVAPPEMQLLYESIKADGYTMPVVCYYAKDEDVYVIVDGFHRNRIAREYPDIQHRIQGYLPVTTLNKPLDQRIAATIRHNRARGTHGIRPMSAIIMDLTRSGWSDEKICSQLGMELDEVLRLKQITGLKEAFMNHEFSRSWEEFEKKYYET